MNFTRTDKRVARWVIAPATLLLLALAWSASAGPFHGKHGMNPLEKMIDHIDLTDEQEEKVEAIIDRQRAQMDFRKGFAIMKTMIELNPDEANYLEAANEQADLAAQKIKEKILATASARKEIYELLTFEQKDELNEVISRKVARMEKRLAKHDD